MLGSFRKRGPSRAFQTAFQLEEAFVRAFSFKGRPMLYKCANEACNTPFRRLREGKLFQVETEYFVGHASSSDGRKAKPGRRTEHYWLCDACFPFVTLTFDQRRGVITVPLPDGLGKKTVTMVSIDAPFNSTDLEGEQNRQTLKEVLK